jgi:FimV-like protein
MLSMLLVSTSAAALGLGAIDLFSALNQSLKEENRLSVVPSHDVKVTHSSPGRMPALVSKGGATGVAATGVSGDHYGPVRRNDTAWSLASHLRPDSAVSVHQMMLAILNANPSAFIDNNVNGLLVGSVLRIPTRAEIERIGNDAALAEVLRQMNVWEGMRRSPAGSSASRPSISSATEERARALFDSADAGADLPSPSDATFGGGILEIADTESRGAAAGESDGAPNDVLSEKVALFREELAQSRTENEALRAQLDHAVSIIVDTERLAQTADEQLAQMLDFDISQSWHLLVFCIAVIAAGFVRGFAGFAGPATISLLLAQLFAPAQLLPKIMLLEIYAYPMLLRNVRRDAHWRLSVPMAVATISLIPLGVHIMQTTDAVTLKRMIGFGCLSAIAISMSGFQFKRMPPWWLNLLVALVLGLLLSSTFLALPIMTYFFLLPLPAAACRATVISFSVLITPFLAGWIFYRGIVTFDDVLVIAVAGILYFSMIYLGSKAFERANDMNYRRIVQWLLLILAVSALF